MRCADFYYFTGNYLIWAKMLKSFVSCKCGLVALEGAAWLGAATRSPAYRWILCNNIISLRYTFCCCPCSRCHWEWMDGWGYCCCLYTFFSLLNIIIAGAVVVAFILNGSTIFFALIQYLFSQTICLHAPSALVGRRRSDPIFEGY